MTNSLPPETSGHDAPPEADAASPKDDSGKPPSSTVDPAAPDLSEKLLSDYQQIIQHIAAAQPSPEDRVKFAEHLIQALGEQGFQRTKDQMEKEHHPLRHVMAEIHSFVKKHGADLLIALLVPSIGSAALGGGVPQLFPPQGPQIEEVELTSQQRAQLAEMVSSDFTVSDPASHSRTTSEPPPGTWTTGLDHAASPIALSKADGLSEATEVSYGAGYSIQHQTEPSSQPDSGTGVPSPEP